MAAIIVWCRHAQYTRLTAPRSPDDVERWLQQRGFRITQARGFVKQPSLAEQQQQQQQQQRTGRGATGSPVSSPQKLLKTVAAAALYGDDAPAQQHSPVKKLVLDGSRFTSAAAIPPTTVVEAFVVGRRNWFEDLYFLQTFSPFIAELETTFVDDQKRRCVKDDVLHDSYIEIDREMDYDEMVPTAGTLPGRQRPPTASTEPPLTSSRDTSANPSFATHPAAAIDALPLPVERVTTPNLGVRPGSREGIATGLVGLLLPKKEDDDEMPTKKKKKKNDANGNDFPSSSSSPASSASNSPEEAAIAAQIKRDNFLLQDGAFLHKDVTIHERTRWLHREEINADVEAARDRCVVRARVYLIRRDRHPVLTSMLLVGGWKSDCIVLPVQSETVEYVAIWYGRFAGRDYAGPTFPSTPTPGMSGSGASGLAGGALASAAAEDMLLIKADPDAWTVQTRRMAALVARSDAVYSSGPTASDLNTSTSQAHAHPAAAPASPPPATTAAQAAVEPDASSHASSVHVLVQGPMTPLALSTRLTFATPTDELGTMVILTAVDRALVEPLLCGGMHQPWRWPDTALLENDHADHGYVKIQTTRAHWFDVLLLLQLTFPPEKTHLAPKSVKVLLTAPPTTSGQSKKAIRSLQRGQPKDTAQTREVFYPTCFPDMLRVFRPATELFRNLHLDADVVSYDTQMREPYYVLVRVNPNSQSPGDVSSTYKRVQIAARNTFAVLKKRPFPMFLPIVADPRRPMTLRLTAIESGSQAERHAKPVIALTSMRHEERPIVTITDQRHALKFLAFRCYEEQSYTLPRALDDATMETASLVGDSGVNTDGGAPSVKNVQRVTLVLFLALPIDPVEAATSPLFQCPELASARLARESDAVLGPHEREAASLANGCPGGPRRVAAFVATYDITTTHHAAAAPPAMPQAFYGCSSLGSSTTEAPTIVDGGLASTTGVFVDAPPIGRSPLMSAATTIVGGADLPDGPFLSARTDLSSSRPPSAASFPPVTGRPTVVTTRRMALVEKHVSHCEIRPDVELSHAEVDIILATARRAPAMGELVRVGTPLRPGTGGGAGSAPPSRPVTSLNSTMGAQSTLWPSSIGVFPPEVEKTIGLLSELASVWEEEKQQASTQQKEGEQQRPSSVAAAEEGCEGPAEAVDGTRSDSDDESPDSWPSSESSLFAFLGSAAASAGARKAAAAGKGSRVPAAHKDASSAFSGLSSSAPAAPSLYSTTNSCTQSFLAAPPSDDVARLLRFVAATCNSLAADDLFRRWRWFVGKALRRDPSCVEEAQRWRREVRSAIGWPPTPPPEEVHDEASAADDSVPPTGPSAVPVVAQTLPSPATQKPPGHDDVKAAADALQHHASVRRAFAIALEAAESRQDFRRVWRQAYTLGLSTDRRRLRDVVASSIDKAYALLPCKYNVYCDWSLFSVTEGLADYPSLLYLYLVALRTEPTAEEELAFKKHLDEYVIPLLRQRQRDVVLQSPTVLCAQNTLHCAKTIAAHHARAQALMCTPSSALPKLTPAQQQQRQRLEALPLAPGQSFWSLFDRKRVFVAATGCGGSSAASNGRRVVFARAWVTRVVVPVPTPVVTLRDLPPPPPAAPEKGSRRKTPATPGGTSQAVAPLGATAPPGAVAAPSPSGGADPPVVVENGWVTAPSPPKPPKAATIYFRCDELSIFDNVPARWVATTVPPPPPPAFGDPPPIPIIPPPRVGQAIQLMLRIVDEDPEHPDATKLSVCSALYGMPPAATVSTTSSAAAIFNGTTNGRGTTGAAAYGVEPHEAEWALFTQSLQAEAEEVEYRHDEQSVSHRGVVVNVFAMAGAAALDEADISEVVGMPRGQGKLLVDLFKSRQPLNPQ